MILESQKQEDLTDAQEEGNYTLYAYQGVLTKQPYFLGVTVQDPEDRLNTVKQELINGKRPQVTLCLAIEALWSRNEDTETCILSHHLTKSLAIEAKKAYQTEHYTELSAALSALIKTNQTWSVYVLGDSQDEVMNAKPQKFRDTYYQSGNPFYVMLSQHTSAEDLRNSLDFYAAQDKKGRGKTKPAAYIKKINELVEANATYEVVLIETFKTKSEAQNKRYEVIEGYKLDGITVLNSRYTLKGVRGSKANIDYRALWRAKMGLDK